MNPTYERIRAACCSEHGFGRRNEEGRWIPRDDPKQLDQHAHYIAKLVSEARELHAKTTEKTA